MSEPVLMSVLSNVVNSGVCVGCGACAVVEPERVEIQIGTAGAYLPVGRSGGPLPDDLETSTNQVCPFSGEADDEDVIGHRLFAGAGVAHHDAVGYHRSIVAGHVTAADFRSEGTSGGMTSWVLHELLANGDVDAVVHVASDPGHAGGALSKYTISRSTSDLLAGRKSRYHVQTLTDVMREVKSVPGRYAFVGVPCFAKTVRLLASADPVIAERVTFVASLFCGHQKSTLFSQYLAWSAGVEPNDLVDIDYRHKTPGRPANRYSVKVSQRSGTDIVRGVEHIPMSDWGVGLFKLGACDYCDDVVGETADISLGDAWLPPLMSDWRGANVAIARSEQAAQLVERGRASGALSVVPWTAEQAAQSQEAALRHRRAGLAIRLANRAATGTWAPRKRVTPADPAALASPLGVRMLSREAIAEASASAFLEARSRGDIRVFTRTMAPLVRRYHGRRSVTALRRVVTWVFLRLPPSVERVIRRLTGGRRFS